MIERLLEHVSIVDGCWLWTGGLLPNGYGRMWFDGESHRTHRLSFEFFVGPIPPGLVLDHECHNRAAERGECAGGPRCPHRACLNPDHLVARTRGDNTRRSPLRGSLWRRALSHCKRGHAFDEANTYMHGGRRHCRMCRAAQAKGTNGDDD